jgi:riboflavin kinase/FMN adenylyltransferase
MQSHTIDAFPDALRGGAVVIGNFDGVHKGHAWVLQVARGYGLPVVVLTFEPHPRAVLLPNSPPFRLTPAEAKADALAKAGADAVVTLPFDVSLAALDPRTFAETLIGRGLSPGLVVVGHDYRFGRDRGGDTALLAEVARAHGFRVITASPSRSNWGERYASSRIRDHILAGEMTEAQRMLGRPWTLAGQARALGDGRLALPMKDYIRPAPGRYACTLRSESARPAHGAAVLDGAGDWLFLEGVDGEGPITAFLHQRLGPADARQTPREGAAASSHIFYAAE